MKNDLTRYMLREHFKSSVLVSAVIAGFMSLFFIILALVIGETDDKSVNNFITIILLVWGGFVSSIGAGINGINMSIYMNRSRKTAVKSIFTTILLICAVTAAIAVAAEGLAAGVAHTQGFGYAFRPLLYAGRETDTQIGFLTVICAYAFDVLALFAVSVASLFIVAASMAFGKWVWIGWWIFYMLLLMTGKSVIRAVGGFAKDIFGSTSGAVLVALLAAAVVFTVLDIMLIRRVQLKKSALMWTQNARRA